MDQKDKNADVPSELDDDAYFESSDDETREPQYGESDFPLDLEERMEMSMNYPGISEEGIEYMLKNG